MEASLNELQDMVINSNGKLFGVSFIKKDGSPRDMVCRLGVKSYIKGTGKPSFALNKDNPYQLVFDFQKKAYIDNIKKTEKKIPNPKLPKQNVKHFQIASMFLK